MAFVPRYPLDVPAGFIRVGVGTDSNEATRFENASPATPLGMTRDYWLADNSGFATSMRDKVISNHAAGRTTWASFKTHNRNASDTWAQTANGDHQASIDDLLTKLKNTGINVWLTPWHEPENDVGNAGTAAQWRAMTRYVESRRVAVGATNVLIVPCTMSSTFGSGSGRNPADWVLTESAFPLHGIDPYTNEWASNPYRITKAEFTQTLTYLQDRGKDIAIAECGGAIGTTNVRPAGLWQAFHDHSIREGLKAICWFDLGNNEMNASPGDPTGALYSAFKASMRASTAYFDDMVPPTPSDITVSVTFTATGETLSAAPFVDTPTGPGVGDFYSDTYSDTYDGSDPELLGDTYSDTYGDTYGEPGTSAGSTIDVSVTFDAAAADIWDVRLVQIGDLTADFGATGSLTATAEVVPVGVVVEGGSATHTATGALSVTSGPTIVGTGGSDITISVTFRASGYTYMQPTRVRRNPSRLLVASPTTAIRTALEAAQVNVWRVVDILNADETIWQAEATITEGKVAVDLSRDERRTLDLTLANPDDTYAPDPNGFWYDKIIRVRRGVELDGTRYEFDLGHFMIDQISPGKLNATISVSGRDYTKKMMKSHIEAAETFKATDRVEEVIRALAYNSGITRVDVPFTGLTLKKEYTFDADTPRWDMAKEIATAFAYDIYFAVNGAFTMRKQQDPVTNPSVLTIGTAGRNTVSLDPSTNDSEMYNHVVVTTPSEGDTLPVWASAENNEPSSPTRIERIGRRTKKMESALATTKAQCAEIAQKFLAVSGLEQFEIGFSVVNYPWLDVGNVITVDNPKAVDTDPTSFLLTSLDIPVSLGPMGGGCKRITVVGNTVTTGGGGASASSVVWGDEAA